MPVDPIQALNEGPAEDTPETPEVETEAPVEDTPESPEQLIDYEARYDNLRSFSDRRDQERLAEIQQYKEQLEALQSQQQTPQYDEEDDDPLVRHVQQMEARQAALEQQLRERAEADTRAQQLEQEYTYIDNELEAIERKLGTKFSDKLANRLGRDAASMRDEQGRPDVARAFAEWRADIEAEKKAWVETKPSGGKPAAGPGAVEVPDLDDPDEVERVLNEAFDAHFGG